MTNILGLINQCAQCIFFTADLAVLLFEIFGGQKENLINMLFAVQRGDTGLQDNQPHSSIQTIIVSLNVYRFRPKFVNYRYISSFFPQKSKVVQTTPSINFTFLFFFKFQIYYVVLIFLDVIYKAKPNFKDLVPGSYTRKSSISNKLNSTLSQTLSCLLLT